MKQVSRFKLYSCGFSVSPLTILHLMLHRKEIALFLHNNQTISRHSSIHSSHVKNEVLSTLSVITDDTKERVLYHSNDSIILFQSQKHLFILSSSTDSEANTPSSSFLFNPHPYNSIHPYAIPTRQKQHQKMNTSPNVPFPFHYHHSQSITFISTLKSHTAHSLVILIPITPFLSTSIHQYIRIKSDIQFHPSLRLQPITHSPHSIHSTQYSPLLSEFKSIHFTHHL